VDFASFEHRKLTLGNEPLCDGVEEVRDRSENFTSFFTSPIEQESLGDPSTKQFTSLNHFKILQNKRNPIKRDQIEQQF
jgi:hypothetical protein